MADSALKRAVDRYWADARFRAVAQSIVARVMQDHGPIDPERPDYDAQDIALQAVVLLLQRVYEEDPELAATRAERDYYKKIAEDVLFMTPRSFVIAKPDE